MVKGSGAVFSPCKQYRYSLWRQWDDRRWQDQNCSIVNWIMLNPSTADATKDDPTVRRCIGFSKDWGAGGCRVYNIFALRATDPKQLYVPNIDPVGPANDRFLSDIPDGIIVAAWGLHGRLHNRSRAVLKMLQKHHVVFSLGFTKDNEPKHPLYLSSVSALQIVGDRQ